MTPERWEQIGQVYEQAREMVLSERATFLARACAGDEELRREVESLLAAEATIGDFIAAPALKDAAAMVTARERSRKDDDDECKQYERRPTGLALGHELAR